MVDEKVITDVVTDDDEPDGLKTYDAEYVKKLKAEAKGYRQDKAALKKEYEEIKAKLDKIEADKLTDLEKKDKAITDLTKQLEDIQGSIKAKDIDNLILKSVAGKNIVDMEAAELLIKKELSSEEEITDKVVEKVVDKLLKDKPFLINSANVNPSDGNFKKQDNDLSPKDGVEVLKKFVGGYVK